MTGTIRIDDPADVGRVMGHVRVMLGLSMRKLARQVAERTGRNEDRVRAQLWAWETGRAVPAMKAASPFLAELGIGLAFVPLDQDGPESGLKATETDANTVGVDGSGVDGSSAAGTLSGGDE